MKTKSKAREPNTDAEFETAIEKLGYELIDHDESSFSVRRKKTGSTTGLEAEDYSSALFEAWSLVRE